MNIWLFWFAMLVNEYKPEFNDRKVRKMRNLGNVYICGSPFVMSRTDAQSGLYSNLASQGLYNSAVLAEVRGGIKTLACEVDFTASLINYIITISRLKFMESNETTSLQYQKVLCSKAKQIFTSLQAT